MCGFGVERNSHRNVTYGTKVMFTLTNIIHERKEKKTEEAFGYTGILRSSEPAIFDKTSVINKIHHLNITQESHNYDSSWWGAGSRAAGVGSTQVGFLHKLPVLKIRGGREEESTSPSCSRPRHSIRLHPQPRL